MSEPKFYITEEVVVIPGCGMLQSFSATITGVTMADCFIGFGHAYFVEPDPLAIDGMPWAESTLRKKPPLYGTFSQMMDRLKRPVGVPSNAD